MLPMESWPVTQGMPREGASLGSPPSNTAVRPGVGISQYLHDSRGRHAVVTVVACVPLEVSEDECCGLAQVERLVAGGGLGVCQNTTIRKRGILKRDAFGAAIFLA